MTIHYTVPLGSAFEVAQHLRSECARLLRHQASIELDRRLALKLKGAKHTASRNRADTILQMAELLDSITISTNGERTVL